MDMCEEWNFFWQVMENISQVRCNAAECALGGVFKSRPLCQITAFSVLGPRTGGRYTTQTKTKRALGDA